MSALLLRSLPLQLQMVTGESARLFNAVHPWLPHPALPRL
jgi:hypothetical protein